MFTYFFAKQKNKTKNNLRYCEAGSQFLRTLFFATTVGFFFAMQKKPKNNLRYCEAGLQIVRFFTPIGTSEASYTVKKQSPSVILLLSASLIITGCELIFDSNPEWLSPSRGRNEAGLQFLRTLFLLLLKFSYIYNFLLRN